MVVSVRSPSHPSPSYNHFNHGSDKVNGISNSPSNAQRPTPNSLSPHQCEDLAESGGSGFYEHLVDGHLYGGQVGAGAFYFL